MLDYNPTFLPTKLSFLKYYLILGVIFLSLAPTSSAQSVLTAFPGAEGYGASTTGGRGGRIIPVTNLNNAGTGSLRACIEATGPRNCIFTTGGTINLDSPLTINNSRLTIAGQTAPGGGITLRTTRGGDVFQIKASDVIIRYLTQRPGPGGDNHATQIASNNNPLNNIIIDHNSLSWGVDSNIETWYKVSNTTIQRSIISEALNCSTHSKGCHSKGIMIGGYKGGESGGLGSAQISVLNNVMAHNAERNPLMQLCGPAQVINNVIYNPQWTFSHQQLNCPQGESYVDWINNYQKKGPSSTSNAGLKIIPADDGTWSPGKAYLFGNIGPSRPNDSLPNQQWVTLKQDSTSATVLTTTKGPGPSVTSTSAQATYQNLILDADVGNNRGLNCAGQWSTRLDSIDQRILNDVKNGTGKIIDHPSEVGGWLNIAPGQPCQDSDADGLPDQWELLHFDNLAKGNLQNTLADSDQDGYTDLEEYFHGTNPTHPNSGSTPAPKPGDLNGDGVVNLFDFNLLVTKFGNPYTIFDFNDIVRNYER